jgi:hypothetical protein
MAKFQRLCPNVGAVPASSADVEREFSMAGDIATKKRNCLSGKTFRTSCSTSDGAHVTGDILLSLSWRR